MNEHVTEKVLTMRLPTEVYDMLTKLAEKQLRSKNSALIIAIREKYERDVEVKQ